MALIGEIVTQAKFAEIAAYQLTNTTDFVETWAAIQSILVSTANISKILWPARPQNKVRGEYLRELLGVDEDNLLSDRTFRNHFEHYDERIEKWFEDNNSAVYMDSAIDSFEPTTFSLPKFYHRSYNPMTKTLSFRGESMDLLAILTELAKIRKKCRGFVALP